MSMDPRAHAEPDTWCQAPLCRHTNWGGYNRLHYRGTDCPPYSPHPERNESAEFWESVRELARGGHQ